MGKREGGAEEGESKTGEGKGRGVAIITSHPDVSFTDSFYKRLFIFNGG